MTPSTEQANRLMQQAQPLVDRAWKRLSEIEGSWSGIIVVPKRNGAAPGEAGSELLRVLAVSPGEIRAALLEARGLLDAALALVPEDYEPTEQPDG